MSRRTRERGRFQAADASGKVHTIVEFVEETEVSELGSAQREWLETGGYLVTTLGEPVNMISETEFHIVTRGIDVTRI